MEAYCNEEGEDFCFLIIWVNWPFEPKYNALNFSPLTAAVTLSAALYIIYTQSKTWSSLLNLY